MFKCRCLLTCLRLVDEPVEEPAVVEKKEPVEEPVVIITIESPCDLRSTNTDETEMKIYDESTNTDSSGLIVTSDPNFIIDGLCDNTSPCFHDVSIDGGLTYQRMSSRKIIKLYEERGLVVLKHFRDEFYDF